MLCNKGKQTNLSNFSDIFAIRVALKCSCRCTYFLSFRPTMKKRLFSMATVVQDRQAAYTCWNWTCLRPQVKGWGPTQYPVWGTTLSTNRVILHILGLKSSGPIWTYDIPLWGTASNLNMEILQSYQSPPSNSKCSVVYNLTKSHMQT